MERYHLHGGKGILTAETWTLGQLPPVVIVLSETSQAGLYTYLFSLTDWYVHTLFYDFIVQLIPS